MLDVTEVVGLAEAAWEEVIINHEVITPTLIIKEKKGSRNRTRIDVKRELRDEEQIKKLLFL